MFVLRRGRYQVAKMEYSYARRAQSVTQTLHWKDVAIIETEDLAEAIAEAKTAITDWKARGYTAERWTIEGRGKQVKESHDFDVFEFD